MKQNPSYEPGSGLTSLLSQTSSSQFDTANLMPPPLFRSICEMRELLPPRCRLDPSRDEAFHHPRVRVSCTMIDLKSMNLVILGQRQLLVSSFGEAGVNAERLDMGLLPVWSDNLYSPSLQPARTVAIGGADRIRISTLRSLTHPLSPGPCADYKRLLSRLRPTSILP